MSGYNNLQLQSLMGEKVKIVASSNLMIGQVAIGMIMIVTRD